MLKSTAAAKSKNTSKPTAAYILVSTLAAAYRRPEIIAPSLIGSEADEAAYIGLCTMIVSYIAMQEVVPEAKLTRALSRLNIDKNTPIGTTEATLKKMATQGYIWRVTDKTDDGDDQVDYRVGPRGKLEIDKRAVRAFVKEIYGDNAPEDIEKRLNRSLHMDVATGDKANGAEEEPEEENGGPSRRASGRRRRADDSDDE